MIYGMLCDGKSRTSILQATAELWGISERTADEYIKRGREKLAADCRMTREAFMAEALAGYRSIREQAEQKGQFQTAKSCVDSMVELTSLKR